ncbi:MAG: hypothetical protein R3288_15800 [Woeseiaceae bacterium]|nr:hypothetical protein [Woeseiaceae bacterium]
MNDIRTVRAAAPSVQLLRKYNALKTENDPSMPCMTDYTSAGDDGSSDDHSSYDDDSSSDDHSSYDDDSSSEDGSSDDDSSSEDSGGSVGTSDGGTTAGDNGGGTTGGDTGGGEPPPVPVSCGCWTPEQIAEIDGILAASRAGPAGAKCTLNENAGGVYAAQVFEGYNVDALDPVTVQSAYAYVDENGGASPQGCMFQSPGTGILNFPLTDRAEGEACIQMIVDHCAANGF